jgi:hypothetical protein
MKYLISVALLFSCLTLQAQETPTFGNFGGAYVGGLEYWPFDDENPGSPYPDRVIWSFGGGSEPAQKCMLEANKTLISWLEDAEHPVTKAIAEFKEAGGRASFFMWTNDYTKAPRQARNARPNRVWYWSSNNDPVHGLLKFESTLLADGTCKTPTAAQASLFISQRAQMLRNRNEEARQNESRRRQEAPEQVESSPSSSSDESHINER